MNSGVSKFVGERAIAYSISFVAFGASFFTAIAIYLHQEEEDWSFRAAALACVAALATAVNQFRREGKIEKLSKEILAAAQKAVGEITGGDSFALAYFPIANGIRVIALRHFGEHTLIGIRVTAISLRTIPVRVLDDFVFPRLRKGDIEVVKPIELSGRSVAFQLTFAANNETWMQNVKAETVGGELVFALRAWRPGDDGVLRILREDVDDRYPRGADKFVDWGMGPAIDIASSTLSTESREEMIDRLLGMKTTPAPQQKPSSTRPE